MSRIFISYRHADCSELAGRLSERLKLHVPEAAVFLDVTHLEMGEDFSHAIFRCISQCEIVLCLISPNWVDELAQPAVTQEDWVKMELETAIRLKKVIIPILVESDLDIEGVDLPSSIRALRRLHYYKLQKQSDEELDLIGQAASAKLKELKLKRMEKLAQQIAKPVAAIQHVWSSIGYAAEHGEDDPDPHAVWQAVVAHAQEKYGEDKWKRILNNFKLSRSEDVGLVVYACIVADFFVASPHDDPSDYWGIGQIDEP